jgi:ubiquinone/menaquinone biosynthesis C-methylase UbiE
MTSDSTNRSSRGPFTFVAGFVTAVSMTVGRGPAARLVPDLADLHAGDCVVDVGCGAGAAVREAQKRGARAIGVDPSRSMLRLARRISSLRHIDGVTFVEGVAEALPVPESSSTVLWALSSVHHWSDRRAGFAEARRVLIPGGRLVLAERLVPLGARGHAAHGFSADQADAVSTELAFAGFTDIRTATQRSGRRALIMVAGTSPS